MSFITTISGPIQMKALKLPTLVSPSKIIRFTCIMEPVVDFTMTSQ
jgi:hypothetical protein